MKRILALVFMMMAVFTTCFAANEPAAPKEPAKVHALYYYGETCGFCKRLVPWLNEMDEKYKDDLVIERHEIFNNREENKKYNQMMQLYNVRQESRGTPTMIINRKVLIGTDQIQNQFEAEFLAAKEALKAKEAEKIAQQEEEAKAKAKTEPLTLTAIFLAAAADSINPCAMMVLLILLGSLIVYQQANITRVVASVCSFISAVFLTYFILGLGIINIIVSSKMAEQVSIGVGIIAIIVGILNLKDVFWYRKGGVSAEVPDGWKKYLTDILLKASSPLGAFAAGTVVTMFELPCTGGPYLFGLSLIASETEIFDRFLYLFLYNIVFVSPLVAIAILCVRGTVALQSAEEFREKHLPQFRLITGVVMLAGGIWLTFFH